ncbi:hypothetical protein D1K53_20920 [Salmonella enterica]|nr:hypothetical protein [Salmonella enterica]
MTHRELQGKMIIKEEIVADLGLRAWVGIFLLLTLVWLCRGWLSSRGRVHCPLQEYSRGITNASYSDDLTRCRKTARRAGFSEICTPS